jgi:hypothetical protein
MSALTLPELRERFAALPPPVVVFNKSHSGSRLLARLLAASGVFMGADRNASEDALPLLKLVQYFVQHYHPDASALWDETRPVDGALLGLVEGVFADHLRGHDGIEAWGWKLCETVYALPLIDFLFPGARFVHLIRDGRDVAFSDHVAPVEPFWQKVFVDAVGVGHWRGLAYGTMARIGYRLDAGRYNMQHWCNAVSLGRRYGAMLHGRYLEVRYEALCREFEAEAARVLGYAGAPDAAAGIAALRGEVSLDGVGKFRRQPWWRRRRVAQYGRPLLKSLGYDDA